MINKDLQELLIAELTKVADLQGLLQRAHMPGNWFLVDQLPAAQRPAMLVNHALGSDWARALVGQLLLEQPENVNFGRILYALEHDVVHASPFPIQLPLAVQLVRVMATLYPDWADAKPFVAAAQTNIDLLNVPTKETPLRMWRVLLEQIALQGTTDRIVRAALAANPDGPNGQFLQDLLDQKPASVPAAVAAGGVKAIAGDDGVSRNEALLFYDNLMIPIGRVPGLVSSINTVYAFANAVCKLEVTDSDGNVAVGTGFRIGGDWILTNEHVLVPKSKAIRVDVRFEIQSNKTKITTTRLKGDITTIKVDRASDWGVIRVAKMEQSWPIIDLEKHAMPKVDGQAFIIQHPGGDEKRLAFVRNTITNVDTEKGVVHYLTDTEQGSSGAPVFDQNGAIVALHHRGGEPQIRAGKPPIVKNEGILISVVRDAVKGLLNKP